MREVRPSGLFSGRRFAAADRFSGQRFAAADRFSGQRFAAADRFSGQRFAAAGQRFVPLLLAAACLLGACQRGIGDACDTALRCSTSGTRTCDLTQPKGYCTLPGCDVGTCPSESVCVRFWPRVERDEDADRLGTNYCMRKCDERSDCRDDEGYDCLSQTNFGAGHESRVLGDEKQRFCAVRSQRVDPSKSDAGSESTSE